MANTPLQIAINCAEEIGIVEPAAVFASGDQNIIKLRRMMNREGRELAKARDWTVLIRTATFTTVNGQAEYALPSDYSRLIYNSEWDRTGFRPLQGPLSPPDWESIQSGGLASVAPFRRYRIVRSATSISRKFVVDPTPSVDGDTLAFEYISDAWCTASDGTTLKSEFTADTDIALLGQDLLELGTIVRFKRSVGLDYGSEASEYADMLAREKARDRPARTLDMAGRTSLRLIDERNFNPSGLGS